MPTRPANTPANPAALPLPHLVIFDWDNTLVQNWQALLAAMNAALAAFALPLWDEARMVASSKHSLRDGFPAIFGEAWQQARDIFYQHFSANHLQGLQQLKGAQAVLDFLRQHQIPMAVCSNKNGVFLRREVAYHKWNDYFVAVVGATDAARDKPDAAPVQMVLAACQQPAGKSVWFVGDTATDMITAANSGCLAVGVGKDAWENPAFPPEKAVADLPELLRLLQQC